MKDIPRIGNVGETSDFHDSSLIAFQYLPLHEVAILVLSTPNEYDTQELWQIRLSGVLAIEFETLGDGQPQSGHVPPEIYDVYDDASGSAGERWKRRLHELGVRDFSVHVITFASSFLRGWGDKSDLEGIRVVCRNVNIERAPRVYHGQEFSRPRIQGGD